MARCGEETRALEENESISAENGTLEDVVVDKVCFMPYSMRATTYIVPTLFAFIFLIGVVANGSLVFIYMKYKSMRTVPNMYIMSLALGDLCLIVFCVPFTSTLYTFESWPYGEAICKFSEFIKDQSVGVSVFTLTALSMERYSAVKIPLRSLRARFAARKTRIVNAGIWILATLLAVPAGKFSYLKTIGHGTDVVFLVCYPYPAEFGNYYSKAMVVYRFLAYYAIPMTVIAVYYIRMARHLLICSKTLQGEAQVQTLQINSRKKVAKIVLSFVVIFALCFFPQHLFLLWFYFDPNSQQKYNVYWHILRIIGFCLSFINSCVNPIALYYASRTFRHKFRDNLLCCCFCDNSSSINSCCQISPVCGGGVLSSVIHNDGVLDLPVERNEDADDEMRGDELQMMVQVPRPDLEQEVDEMRVEIESLRILKKEPCIPSDDSSDSEEYRQGNMSEMQQV